MDCSSANKGNLIPGMLSAPGMVPAAASSRDRTSKSLALPEARSKRSSEKETVGTGKEDIKDLRARGPQDTYGLCTPLPGSFPAQCSCLRTAATAHTPLSTNSPTQGTSICLTRIHPSHTHIPGGSQGTSSHGSSSSTCATLTQNCNPKHLPLPPRARNRKQGHGPWSTHTHTIESHSTCW